MMVLLLLALGCRCRNFDDNVGRLTHHFGLETFFGIGRIGYRTNEAIRIDHRVAAFDHITITHLFAVLVVGEFVVFHIETELIVGWDGLRTGKIEEKEMRCYFQYVYKLGQFQICLRCLPNRRE